MSDDATALSYSEFIAAKVCMPESSGFPCADSEISPLLYPHQRDIVRWAVNGGKRAIFAAFGLGKSMMQLEVLRLILKKCGGVGLIVTPLGVRQEFTQDAEKLGTPVTFVQRTEEIVLDGIYLTNYESVRDGKVDPKGFKVVSLDEGDILRGFGGSKTFREFMRIFEFSGIHRFVATATPDPNEFIELLAYAAFLGIMDVGQAKTRFFKRDSTKADKLTIHPHKEKEFWLWVSSWAIFLQKPSDLGYSDAGYTLPELDVRWHEVASDHGDAGFEKNGQGKLYKNSAIGVSESAREKRDSLPARMAKMLELRAEDPPAHRILWHDLESERAAIEAAVPGIVSIYGALDLDKREKAVIDFSHGRIAELAAKPSVAGSGCNFQRHCAWAIFLGIGFKFKDFIQAIHRIQRFLQPRPVRIDIIYTDAEREVKHQLERKWNQHKKQVEHMSVIIREHGLSAAALSHAMNNRAQTVTREEYVTPRVTMVNNDYADEVARMAADSVGLILTSVPFGNQYEYSPSYLDLGHTNDAAHFFAQMDYGTPNLLRVLQPGRMAIIHVKDRVTPGGLTGLGFQTVYPFHADCIAHYTKHGFAYLGMVTVVTDVVRENAQTYRLGWSEQCKDGSRMGIGMPEYLLYFRKPPTDSSNGYADVPVSKSKEQYSRGRWQFDAHGFHRSSGNRLLCGDDFKGLSHGDVFKLFKQHSLKNIYNFETDVQIAERLDARGMLPPTFMLCQPQSANPDVWTDVTRMLTLNGIQHAKGKEMHLCPMQFDIADRCIAQFTNPDDLVFDHFAGLGTVPLRALKAGRRGYGVELSPAYYADALYHLRAMEQELATPTLFDLREVAELEVSA